MDLKASREIGESGKIAMIYLIMWLQRSVEFIVGFINQVENVKRPTLAALFIKRPDIVDEVLKKIEYDDYDLMDLT